MIRRGTKSSKTVPERVCLTGKIKIRSERGSGGEARSEAKGGAGLIKAVALTPGAPDTERNRRKRTVRKRTKNTKKTKITRNLRTTRISRIMMRLHRNENRSIRSITTTTKNSGTVIYLSIDVGPTIFIKKSCNIV